MKRIKSIFSNNPKQLCVCLFICFMCAVEHIWKEWLLANQNFANSYFLPLLFFNIIII